MPSLKAIRNRIASVKNTQKITRAMKLVSAARLKRAQDAMFAMRPYAKRIADIVADVAAKNIPAEGEEPIHPFMERRHTKRARLIVVTSDRGLAGGFNSNLIRHVERFVVEQKANFDSIELSVVGRKGREHFKRRKVPLFKEYAGAAPGNALELAREVGQEAASDFLGRKPSDPANQKPNPIVDDVFVVFNEFKSAIAQTITIERLLPLDAASAGKQANLVDFEYDPSKQEFLATLLPLYLESRLLRVMLESIASEFGARMAAMDSATKNAKEMISSLSLSFNRARQAAITKELMEIVGGAEALKG